MMRSFPKNASLSPDGNLVVLRDESVREVESGKVVVDELVGHSRLPSLCDSVPTGSRSSPPVMIILHGSGARPTAKASALCRMARVWRMDLFSPDGQWIATRSDMVRIWDAATEQTRGNCGPPRPFMS